jgi:type I restriction enzyme S subunit
MSFPRYPKYKDSGVEWLGQVPEHWEAIRYKNVFEEKFVEAGGALPLGSISFGRVVFKSDEFFNEATKATYQEVLAGEFLINPINLNYDLKSLRTALSEINTCVSPAYIVLKAKGTPDKDFLKHQLHAFDLFHMKTLGAGVRQTITFADIGACRTYLPPLPEQTRITAFLDQETAKIDELVTEQERLMALLKEKRQAVISHAVTKGLNNSDVPLRRLKFLVDSIETGFTPNSYGHPAQAGQCGVLKSGCVNHGVFDPEENKLLDEKVDPPADLEVKAGDVLMSRASGSSDLIGSVALVHETPLPRLFLSDKTFRVSQKHELVEAEYFVWAMNSKFLRTQISQIISGAEGLAKNIAQSNIRELLMPVPDIDAQKAIVCFIRKEVERFDTLTAEAQRAIDLLQERRTALISAAVTGQIDVRNH